MKHCRHIIVLLCILLCGGKAISQSAAMKVNVLDRIAHTYYHPNFSSVTASLLLGVNTRAAYGQLDTLLGKEYGDMFWMYGCAGLYFSCREVLPVAYREKIREAWKLLTPYRGDTENHFLMYYGSLFLMSEEWDSLPASEWFMGRSSKEIHSESREWLMHWIDETVKFGMTEFDSPRYLYYYITPLVLLAEYSRDAEVRTKSHMMLEYLLAHYAVKYLNGSYVGAHSRESNEVALAPINAEALTYGEYFFEDSVRHVLPDVAFAAASDLRVSSLLRAIAHQQGLSECTEFVRSRRRLRFETPAVKQVHKYTFIDQNYALGSIDDGIVQPIQQRTWSLVLRSNEKYNAIVGLHPYFSARELGSFFPEEPSFMFEKIEGVKNGYTSEDKWVGASPYEQLWQRKNQLKCLYDVPKDFPIKHVDVFLPAWGNFTEVDSTVWHEVTVRYDSVLVTLHTNGDFSMSAVPGGYRLRIPLVKGKAGYWLYVNNGPDDGGIDPHMFSGEGEYDSDGQAEMLVSSPALRSAYGSGVITMRFGTKQHVLDFTHGKTYDR
jgi:hypothetical protein